MSPKEWFKEFSDGVIWGAQAPMIPFLKAIMDAQGKPVWRLRLTMALYGYLVWQSIGFWVAVILKFFIKEVL